MNNGEKMSYGGGENYNGGGNAWESLEAHEIYEEPRETYEERGAMTWEAAEVATAVTPEVGDSAFAESATMVNGVPIEDVLEPIMGGAENMVVEAADVSSEVASVGRSERVAATIEKAKSGFGGFKKALGVAAMAALVMAVAAGCGKKEAVTESPRFEMPEPTPTPIVEVAETPSVTDLPPVTIEGIEDYESVENVDWTGNEVLNDLIDGSFDQYGNPGCYGETEEARNAKHSPDSVGNPVEVLKLMGVNSLEEATPEQMQAVNAYFAFSMKEPAAATAMIHNLEGFEGLTYEQAAAKIENMSPEEKSAFALQMKEEVFDKSISEHGEITSDTEDLYIGQDANGNKYAKSASIYESGTKVLVMTTENEDGSKTIEKIKEVCGNIVLEYEVVKPDGTTETVVIVVEPKDPEPSDPSEPSGPSEPGEPSGPNNPEPGEPSGPDEPSESDPDEPGSGYSPKSGAAQVQNAGGRVNQQPLDEGKTSATSLEQDQANFSAMEQQKRDDAAAAEAAAVEVSAQTERERAAAAEAEQRRQEEAAARAEAEAAAAAGADTRASMYNSGDY